MPSSFTSGYSPTYHAASNRSWPDSSALSSLKSAGFIVGAPSRRPPRSAGGRQRLADLLERRAAMRAGRRIGRTFAIAQHLGQRRQLLEPGGQTPIPFLDLGLQPRLALARMLQQAPGLGERFADFCELGD